MQAGEYHFVVTLNLGSVTVTRDGATLVLEGARSEQVYNEVVEKSAAHIRSQYDWLPLVESPVVVFFHMQLQQAISMQAGEYHFVVTLNLGSVTVTKDGTLLVREGARSEQVYTEMVDKAVADIGGQYDSLPLVESPVVVFFHMQPQ